MKIPKQFKLWFIICAVLLLPFVVIGWDWFSQRGVHKLQMPGNYLVHLPSDIYIGYYFWEWPSKGLKIKPHRPDVRFDSRIDRAYIYDRYKDMPKGKLFVNYDSFDKSAFRFGENTGRPEFELRAYADGWYTISSSEKAIIVIVPQDNTFTSITDTDDFTGSNDDFNFDAPARK